MNNSPLSMFQGLGPQAGSSQPQADLMSQLRSLGQQPQGGVRGQMMDARMTEYEVNKGDTLTKISRDHGTSVQSLIAMNPEIKNPDRIFHGQRIRVPNPEYVPEDQRSLPESPVDRSYAQGMSGQDAIQPIGALESLIGAGGMAAGLPAALMGMARAAPMPGALRTMAPTMGGMGQAGKYAGMVSTPMSRGGVSLNPATLAANPGRATMSNVRPTNIPPGMVGGYQRPGPMDPAAQMIQNGTQGSSMQPNPLRLMQMLQRGMK